MSRIILLDHITDEDSSHDGSQNLDDYEGQYEEAECDEEGEYDNNDDKPSEASQEISQGAGNEEYEGQFDDDFEGIVFKQKDVQCNVQEKARIPESWILLDSQSTVDVFCNARLLHNIWDAKRQLALHCNAGTTLVTKKGDLRGYGTVWFHPMGIANILSLSNVSKKYRVTYDSGDKEEQGLVVHKEDGSK